jgi:hypothetical protein
LIYEVRIWDVCRPAEQLLASMEELVRASVGLIADYAFRTIPAIDVNRHKATSNSRAAGSYLRPLAARNQIHGHQ